jgi:hypothetical protein
MLSFQVWLPVGAIGLYLFDSALLLYSNELLFLRRRGGWSFVESSSLLLAGRRICLPNPFMPATPQFRVRWSEHDTRTEQEDGGDLERFCKALRPVQYLVAALLVIMIILPVELLLYGTGIELLVVMAAFYLVVIAALGCVLARRHDLRLSGRAFLALAFDALACAPFAIKLVRKVCMRRGLAGSAISFARETFDPAVFPGLIQAVIARVSGEQQREYGQTARWSELESYRKELAGLQPGYRPEGK